MAEQIVSTLIEGILQIRMSRPEKKNAITAAMYQRMADMLEDADRNVAVLVITLTGEGDCFTSGNDIADFLANAASSGQDLPVVRFLKAISKVAKPLIAGVNGMAIGIGTTLLLHCDLVYAAQTATFQLPFTNLGLVPEASSSMLLPRLAGYHRAAELMLLGERFDVRKALEIGLVNAVVPADELADRVRARAAALAAKPASSIRATKTLLKREPESVAERIAVETGEFVRLLQSPEARKILQAFMDRRKPD